MTPDAVQDILLDDRYNGMMSTIEGITGVVDSVFMTVITFVAFFIISVALLRNVLAGAYCAFPKFWDQVANAHEENANVTIAEQLGKFKDAYKTASMSSVKQFFFRIVPNIKSLTDFQDDTLSPKSYFIKAIPQMIAVVIIGVFIYNGYYRDFTAIVANTGAELLQRVVLDTDPMEILDTFLNTAGRPHFATDDSIDDYGRNKNKIAVGIYQAIISKYPDIVDANAKAELASQIDTAVNTMFDPNKEEAKAWFGNNVQYKVNITCNLMKDFSADDLWEGIDKSSMTPSADKFRCGWKVGLGKEGSATATSGDVDIRFDSVKDAINEEWYVGVAITAERNATVIKNTSGIEATLTTGSDTTTGAFTNVKGINDSYTTSATSVKDPTKTVKVAVKNAGTQTEKKYTIYINESALDTNALGTEFTCKIPIIVTDDKGKEYKVTITKITYSSGSYSISGENDKYSISGSDTITVTPKETEDNESGEDDEGNS